MSWVNGVDTFTHTVYCSIYRELHRVVSVDHREMIIVSETITRQRENWLNDAVAQLAPKFTELGFPLPELRVSIGWGPQGAKYENAIILGVTLNPLYVTDGKFEVWVSPTIASTAHMLGVLVHELIHCACGFECGHTGDFAECAVRFGFTGSLLEVHMSETLADEMEFLTVELGEYPGSVIDLNKIKAQAPAQPVPAGNGGTGDADPRFYGGGPRISTGPRKQTTRQIRVTCSEDCPCGGESYIVRMSRSTIAIGLPSCPMGKPMMVNP